MNRVHRDLALLLLAVVVCAIPFLRQPFHMDDNFYMDMARNARVKPLYPNDTPYVFEGRYLPDMGSHSHPPLMTYFLALLQRLAGEGPGTEWIYHFAALAFPILAIWAFYFLSARFVSRPLWPALALAVCPLFLVMQHSLMTDVPTLAFWVGAIAAFVWAVDSGRNVLFLLSAIFQFGAMFTSYQSVALLPLLGFYQIRRRGKAAGWPALVAPVALMASWLVLNYFHYHRWVLGGTYGYIRSRTADAFVGILSGLLVKMCTVLEYQGWLILFPLFFIYAFGRMLNGRLGALAFLVAAYAAQVAVPQYRLVDKAIFIVGLMTGLLVLLRMGRAFVISLRRHGPDSQAGSAESQFLGLWYFGVSACCIVLFTEGSARYILPLVPPVLLVFFRELESAEVTEYRLAHRPFMSSAMLASGSLVVSLCWGLVLSQADQEFARIYPHAAREFSRISDGMPSYYAGEWGFRYYMREAGVRQIPVDEGLVQGGSLIAVPKLALGYDIPAPLRSMSMPVHTLTYELATPLRIQDWQTPAGFYSSGWGGLIPFSFSRRSLETVEIQEVNLLVERLPWAKVDSPRGEIPWPGYLPIQGRSPLALLASQGTRISYPWNFDKPLDLDMKCGVGQDAYKDGDGTAFEFDVRQCDSNGTVLGRYHCTLKPGIQKRDRAWQHVQLSLQPCAHRGETLELRFESTGKNPKAIGAFAEAILRPTQ